MNAIQAGWQRLPRDTRDSFFLLAVITMVMAPHAGHLPLWATALTGLVLAWRAHIAWRQRPLPSRSAASTQAVRRDNRASASRPCVSRQSSHKSWASGDSVSRTQGAEPCSMARVDLRHRICFIESPRR